METMSEAEKCCGCGKEIESGHGWLHLQELDREVIACTLCARCYGKTLLTMLVPTPKQEPAVRAKLEEISCGPTSWTGAVSGGGGSCGGATVAIGTTAQHLATRLDGGKLSAVCETALANRTGAQGGGGGRYITVNLSGNTLDPDKLAAACERVLANNQARIDAIIGGPTRAECERKFSEIDPAAFGQVVDELGRLGEAGAKFTDKSLSEVRAKFGLPAPDPLDVEYDGVKLCSLIDLDERRNREIGNAIHVRFTPAQRAAISAHWSAELRAKVAASREAERQCEVSVRCDGDWLDDEGSW